MLEMCTVSTIFRYDNEIHIRLKCWIVLGLRWDDSFHYRQMYLDGHGARGGGSEDLKIMCIQILKPPKK